MIKTELPKEPIKTIYEKFQELGFGFDIADNTYDWINYFECPKDWDKCNDYYDKLMLLFALNIECVRCTKSNIGVCKVCEFIVENIKAFEKFLNETYREEYQPQYLLAKGHKVNDPNEDDWFYDIYLDAFKHLCNGNFSESKYEKLFNYLTEEKGGK